MLNFWSSSVQSDAGSCRVWGTRAQQSHTRTWFCAHAIPCLDQRSHGINEFTRVRDETCERKRAREQDENEANWRCDALSGVRLSTRERIALHTRAVSSVGYPKTRRARLSPLKPPAARRFCHRSSGSNGWTQSTNMDSLILGYRKDSLSELAAYLVSWILQFSSQQFWRLNIVSQVRSFV